MRKYGAGLVHYTYIDFQMYGTKTCDVRDVRDSLVMENAWIVTGFVQVVSQNMYI